MFNKTAYRKRREQGLRGQIDLTPLATIAKWTEDDHKKGKCEKHEIGKERTSKVNMVMTKKGLVASGRKAERRRFVDRAFTKKGVVFGRKEKEDKIIHHIAKKNERNGVSTPAFAPKKPTHDPATTNHDRMIARKKARNERLAKSAA